MKRHISAIDPHMNELSSREVIAFTPCLEVL